MRYEMLSKGRQEQCQHHQGEDISPDGKGMHPCVQHKADLERQSRRIVPDQTHIASHWSSSVDLKIEQNKVRTRAR